MYDYRYIHTQYMKYSNINIMDTIHTEKNAGVSEKPISK